MSDYQQPSHSQAAPNHALAIVSLIASLLGLTLFPAIGSVIGLITGYIARRDIRENPAATLARALLSLASSPAGLELHYR